MGEKKNYLFQNVYLSLSSVLIKSYINKDSTFIAKTHKEAF